MPEKTFGEDLEFLNQHLETIVLRNAEGAAVVVVPEYQGRTMISTNAGDHGSSYGFINYGAVESNVIDPQINLYGGEDRLWVSPEGGQYSIYLEPGAEMSFANWRTPASLDSEPFSLQTKTDSSVSMTKDALFTNWSGTKFNVQMDRTVVLLDSATAGEKVGVDFSKVKLVAHESHNTLINRGDAAWDPETGLIGLWLICMSKPGAKATLFVPFNLEADESPTDDDIVTANYFGDLDETRLKVDRENKILYFLGDGNLRSKLGLNFARVTSTMGSWDEDRQVLSIVNFNLPDSAPANGYSNNLWEMQDEPYAGDVINCYNDGVNDSGTSMVEGGFYEMETVSPALALAPGEGYTHIQRTLRMEGDRAELSAITKSLFGVDLDQISSQFAS